MKIVLAGSPSITVPAFEEVIKHFNVVGIITQPDKKKGRGMTLTETPVSILAKKYNIKLLKPNKIIEIKDELEKLNYDLFLTFAFGQWIPESILSLGKYKPLNIHGSLLPKYRGAAPIHHAILNGEKEIGITLMEMIKEMDAGNMYFKASKVIDEKTTTGEGFKIIEELAKNNIIKWLKLIEENKVNPKQQSLDFTLAPKIKKEMGNLIKYSPKKAIKVIRALNPFPGAYIFINKKRLKVFNASIEKINNAIEVKVKNGKIFITDFQWESKKRKNIW